ncbi:MAG: helix-turn-helix domain-containing protein [Flavobacteriales bacterium]|nr:helix-turn-helix domain-containing protein [Flavobacteriales bacterium]
MKQSTILHELTPEEISRQFEKLNQSIREIKEKFEPVKPTEYLTRNEVATMLKCDLSTIHNWTKKGKLKPYGIGNRIYYKRSEIEAVLVPLGNNKTAD